MKIKQLICGIILGFLLLASQVLFAQMTNNNTFSRTSDLPCNTESFGKGTNIISLGMGIGGEYTYYGDGYASTPNFIIAYDNGTFGNVGPGTISLGGLVSFKSFSGSYTNPSSAYYYNQQWSYYILGFRSAYHWNFTNNPKFDIYAGLMLGYYFTNYGLSSNDPYVNNEGDPYYKAYYVNSYNNYLTVSLFAGVRYYVSPRVGLWAEVGYGYSNLSLGVNFKL